jgi:hypothetical protein
MNKILQIIKYTFIYFVIWSKQKKTESVQKKKEEKGREKENKHNP